MAQISSGVPAANPRAGAPADVLATGSSLTVVARGADARENLPPGATDVGDFVGSGLVS